MKAAIFLALYLSILNFSPVFSHPSLVCVAPQTRGVEIRYIEVVDRTQTEITVDEKKYKLFKTRNEAVDYATTLYPKIDYVIVYVMSDDPKTTEVVEIEN